MYTVSALDPEREAENKQNKIVREKKITCLNISSAVIKTH